MKTARTCSIEGCDSNYFSRGLCKSHYYKKRYANNKDKIKTANREWFSKNREKANSSHREWCANNKEKRDASRNKWCINNKEKINAKSRKYTLELRCWYIRTKFKLPPDTPSNVIDSCRSLMLNVRRMRNERP